MPRLQGLIFDLDGTLVDSAPDLRQALNQMLAEQGRRGVTLDEMKTFIGDGMQIVVQRAFAATGEGISDDESYPLYQDFVGHYRNQKADPSQLYPHVAETLEAYFQEGIKLGLCTNKQEASTYRLLDDLKLAPYFTFVAGGDTFPVRKPHPGHVTGVLKKLAVPAESCVMIGDSSNDVLAAKGAGIPCLVVTHGYGADLGSLGTAGLVNNFRDLRKAMQGLGF